MACDSVAEGPHTSMQCCTGDNTHKQKAVCVCGVKKSSSAASAEQNMQQ